MKEMDKVIIISTNATKKDIDYRRHRAQQFEDNILKRHSWIMTVMNAGKMQLLQEIFKDNQSEIGEEILMNSSND